MIKIKVRALPRVTGLRGESYQRIQAKIKEQQWIKRLKEKNKITSHKNMDPNVYVFVTE